jgi:hypothetical protein
MATPPASNDATQLLDLPSELLQMIFREVFENPRLGCKYQRSTQTAVIADPPSLLVSKKYLEQAKIAMLDEATVHLHRSLLTWLRVDSQKASSSGLYPHFSPDFRLIQHLRSSSVPSPFDTWAWLKAVEAAPLLRTLTLMYKDPIRLVKWPSEVGFGQITEHSTVKLEQHARDMIKSAAEKAIGLCVDSDERTRVWTDLVQKCIERHRDLELVIEMEVIGHMKSDGRDYHISVSPYMSRSTVATSH